MAATTAKESAPLLGDVCIGTHRHRRTPETSIQTRRRKASGASLELVEAIDRFKVLLHERLISRLCRVRWYLNVNGWMMMYSNTSLMAKLGMYVWEAVVVREGSENAQESSECVFPLGHLPRR